MRRLKRRRSQRILGLVLGLPLAMLAACSSIGTQTRQAVVAAASDPWTWAPLAGAATIAATHNDERISHWAMSKTPLYGSRDAATDASNRFRLYASASAWAMFAVTPPHRGENWITGKGMDASSNLVGLAAVRSTTGLLKQTTQRQRPNGSPVRDSFPSAHSSDAFANASLMRYYAASLPRQQPLRDEAQWVTDSFAFATAWGRIEGGFHYPTDVLIGAALANFATHLFMRLDGEPGKSQWQLRTRTNQSGTTLVELHHPL